MKRGNAKITISADSQRPVRFAAEELARYLNLITGTPIEVRAGDAPANALWWNSAVSAGGGSRGHGDSFEVEPNPDGAIIRGTSARAVLHGVYALLEELGCLWSLHHRNEEVIPRLEVLPAIRPLRSTPRFDVRGYSADIMTWHYDDASQLAEHLRADHEFVDWMAKTGANAFLFIRHVFDSQLTIPQLLPDFADRGIDVEYGGHVIPLLLPREVFAQYPQWFPQSAEGTRSDFGNLCTASPAAMQMAAENAVRYVRHHPESRVLHVWGADLHSGGWCHCAKCSEVTPQDQSLRLCNAIARALAEEGAQQPVCYLAYHDTIEPHLRECPEDNVFVEYAPRERCYGHALDDACCPTNRVYREALERYCELFRGRVRIFEYYADAILFCGCAVPLSQVIADDLDFYHGLGIRQITNLQFGSFSLWAYPTNFLAYAAATRHSDCDITRVREQVARRSAASQATVARILSELEEAMRTVVTYGDIRRPPAGPESLRRLEPRITRAIGRLAKLVDTVGPAAADPTAAALQALLRYNQALLTGVRQELLAGTGAAHFDAALDIMRAVDRRFTGLWGTVDLPVIHAYYDAVRQPQ